MPRCIARFLCYNEDMDELKSILARNLVRCRKAAGLTQLQVAEKLNYSDKAVSKWERGEGLPDLSVLVALSEIYGVSLDYLVREHGEEKPPRKKVRGRLVWVLCSCALVWVIATGIYTLLSILGVEGDLWLAFAVAAPVTCVLLVVFAAVWGGRYHVFAAVSGLIWSVSLVIFLSWHAERVWLVFVAAAPLQLLAVFWFILRPKKSK